MGFQVGCIDHDRLLVGGFDRQAVMACCRFRGHEDKIVTKELESGYDETEVQPGV